VIWLNHVCDMPHLYVWYGSFMCVTCLIHVRDMPHSCMRHASFMRWHASFICLKCFIHMCDMPHSCVTCLIHMSPQQPPNEKLAALQVWHDSFVCVTWLITWLNHDCLITNSYSRHLPFICVWHDPCTTHSHVFERPIYTRCYGVATTSRFLTIIGLFCKRVL